MSIVQYRWVSPSWPNLFSNRKMCLLLSIYTLIVYPVIHSIRHIKGVLSLDVCCTKLWLNVCIHAGIIHSQQTSGETHHVI